MRQKTSLFGILLGKIGPYFINADFLYGSEADAKSLVSFIDENKEDRYSFPKKMLDITAKQYKENAIYKDVVDGMIEIILNTIGVDNIDYISGGERRDWVFSYLVANLVQKPHITIYKDATSVVCRGELHSPGRTQYAPTEAISNLNGAKVLHVADLLTVGSSYERAWIPAIKGLNSSIYWSLVAVDRMQGGKEFLLEENITCYSLVDMGEDLFKEGVRLNYISNEQLDMVLEFMADPDGSMTKFMQNHPEFIKNSLNSDDEKTRIRAKLCIENGFYGSEN